MFAEVINHVRNRSHYLTDFNTIGTFKNTEVAQPVLQIKAVIKDAGVVHILTFQTQDVWMIYTWLDC